MVQIDDGHDPIVLVCLNSSNKCSHNELKNQLQALAVNLKTCPAERFLIFGDFNCNVEENNSMLRFCEKLFKCHQKVEHTSTHGTIIDLCFSNTDVTTYPIYTSWSDHNSLIMSVNK